MKKYKSIMIGIIVLVVIAVGSFAYWWIFMRGIVSIKDARFASTIVESSPEISGQLSALLVSEGDKVSAGDILYKLDTKDLQARVASAQTAISVAKAGIAAAQARLDKAERGPRKEEIQSARATVAKVKAQVQLAKLEKNRLQRLVESNSATQQQLDQASTAYQTALKSLEEAQQHLKLLEAGTRPEDIAAAKAQLQLSKAQLESAQARLHEANLALAHAVVTAPFNGTVVKTWHNPGETVSPGMPVVSLMDPASLHIDANVEETDLRKVSDGDLVDISVDAYPDLHLTGTVEAVIDVTQSEFSLMPSEGVSGTFIKVTQRVPLRVSLDDPPAKYFNRLGSGLSVELKIHTNSSRKNLAATHS